MPIILLLSEELAATTSIYSLAIDGQSYNFKLTTVYEHRKRRSFTRDLKMQHSEKDWSDLCHEVKSLVPKELGGDAWYLIIVSTVVADKNDGTLSDIRFFRRPP